MTVKSANTYVLGSRPEIDMTFTDLNNQPFIPLYVRLSVKAPDGDILTVSGGLGLPSGDITSASGYLFYIYDPTLVGWFEYESWGADGTGREIAKTNGFEIIDRVY